MSEREQRGEKASDARQRPGLPLDPYRVWLMFLRNWQVVAVAGVVGAFAGAAVAKKVVKQTFAAHAVLSLEAASPTAVSQRASLLEGATHSTNLQQVARRMNVQVDAATLRSRLSISSSAQSRTIGIEGRWSDANSAANLVNAMVDVLRENRRKQLAADAMAALEGARRAVEGADAIHVAALSAYETFRLESRRSRRSMAKLLALEQAAEVAAAQLAAARAAWAALAKAPPATDLQVIERARPPAYAEPSARKQVAVIFPLASILLSALGLFLWSLRRLDVRTPVEAAFWSKLPVIGASTWPRDPDMLPTLMHDLDDFAPRSQGVILIVGASTLEAELACAVAEWNGYTGQPFGAVDEQDLIDSGAEVNGSDELAVRDGNPSHPPAREGPSMQILTLNGPLPAQSLRRAARLADRVLVVVASGEHDIFQLMQIRGRLGRDEGIGLLFVGLEQDLALVRDRVGDVERFWYARRDAPRVA